MITRTLRYGPHPDQYARLHLPGPAETPPAAPRRDPTPRAPRPDPPSAASWPVAVVLHGGFWRQRYDIALATPLAADLAGRGVAALAVEYRRVGPGGAGGWPATLVDVAAAVDGLRAAGQYLARGRLDLTRVAAVGHSAGGQLAGWLAHRGALPPDDPGAPGPGSVRLGGAVCQAGVLDLVGAHEQALGDGAVIDFLGGSPAAVPDRYRHASPLTGVGDGTRVVCVHGDADDDVPLAQSLRYVERGRAAGDPVRLIRLAGVGHMELVDPAHAAWHTTRAALLEMLAVAPG